MCLLVSVGVSTCHCVSVRVSTRKYASVRVNTYQYASLCVSTCHPVTQSSSDSIIQRIVTQYFCLLPSCLKIFVLCLIIQSQSLQTRAFWLKSSVILLLQLGKINPKCNWCNLSQNGEKFSLCKITSKIPTHLIPFSRCISKLFERSSVAVP